MTEVKLTEQEAQAVRAALSAMVIKSRTGELGVMHGAERFVSTQRIFRKADRDALSAAAREASQTLPIVAIAEEEDSIDVLQLSGATTVLPLKHRLGEYLANRVDTGDSDAQVLEEHSFAAELARRGAQAASAILPAASRSCSRIFSAR